MGEYAALNAALHNIEKKKKKCLGGPHILRIQPIVNSLRLLRAHSATFPCSPATARDGVLIQMQHFCHHVDTIDPIHAAAMMNKKRGLAGIFTTELNITGVAIWLPF